MIASPNAVQLAPHDYLDWEEQQSVKYEYLNGEAYAMTGGTLIHNAIAVNIVSALRTHLRGTGCRAFMSDAKVGITEKGPFFYPDVVVSCDERDRTATRLIQHSCLIIEVFSPSTEGFDRGEKFRHYRCLDSLREYIVVEAERMGVDRYQRNERGTWELTPYNLDERIETSPEIPFSSINFQMSLANIYDEVEFPESLLESELP